ncbi:MAG: TetR family transcriptional regulator [Mucilaginibacter polytrichastri]|nr:TetR family transcriptional regulator [Mucilaginibacter polytrichastri]
MGRKSLKESQQKRIIEAFYEVAKKEGIENASFAMIARELDMLPSLIVHYFPSKQELLHGLIDHIIEEYRRIYQADVQITDPLDKLVHVLNSIFSRDWNTYIDDSVFYNCFALLFRNAQVKEQFRELHFLLREWLETLISESIKSGQLAVEDAAAAADLIFVLSDGAYYFLSMIDDPAVYGMHLERYKQEAFRVLNLEHRA